MEEEKENSLPFLDVEIIRSEDGTTKTKVYRKPTWTGQYTNYFSFVPLKYKIGLIKSLFHRTRKICSPEYLKEDEKLVRDNLINNGYPPNFIDKHSKVITKKERPTTVPKKDIYINIPFKGDDYDKRLSSTLNRFTNKCFAAANPIIIYETNKMPFKSIKDKLTPIDKTNVIYQYKCECGSTYIGRTGRKLSRRIKEHLPIWVFKGEKRNSNSMSAITKHLIDNNCVPNPKLFKILFHSSSFKLKYLESVAISLLKPSLCVQKQFIHSLQLNWL